MATLVYYRQCDSCGGGMSSGYIMHGGEYYFCDDDCISKYWGRKKVFTTLEDWNNNGSGLTWKQFQASWDKLDDNSYEYEWQLDICSYTEWAEGSELNVLYDSKGHAIPFDDIQDNNHFKIVCGEDNDL